MRENKIVIKSVEHGHTSLQKLAEKWTELYVHHQHATHTLEPRGATEDRVHTLEQRGTSSVPPRPEGGGSR